MAQKFNPFTGTFDIVLDKAEEIQYDNGTSGLTATDVQAALDEVQNNIDTLPIPITYKGTWDASTNTPTLANTDTGRTGWLYQVNVAGTVNFGAGAISFEVSDKVVNNGTLWEKWDHTDAVNSVNGQTGNVVLDSDDVAEGASNLYFTDARARTAAVQDSITDGVTTIAPSQNAVFDALATKQPTGNYITSLTGDVTASGPGASAATIANDAVTTVKILNAAVTDTKLATDSVTTIKIQNDAVTDVKLATDSVTTAKIVNAAVTDVKLATDAVTTTKILNDAVTGAKLAGGAVDLAGTKITGTLQIGNGGTGQTTKTPAFDALSPNTTKGDIIVYNGTNNIRLPVGTNGQVLSADSTEASGLKFINPSQGAVTLQAFANQAYSDFIPHATDFLFQFAGANVTVGSGFTYNSSTGEFTTTRAMNCLVHFTWEMAYPGGADIGRWIIAKIFGGSVTPAYTGLQNAKILGMAWNTIEGNNPTAEVVGTLAVPLGYKFQFYGYQSNSAGGTYATSFAQVNIFEINGL